MPLLTSLLKVASKLGQAGFLARARAGGGRSNYPFSSARGSFLGPVPKVSSYSFAFFTHENSSRFCSARIRDRPDRERRGLVRPDSRHRPQSPSGQAGGEERWHRLHRRGRSHRLAHPRAARRGGFQPRHQLQSARDRADRSHQHGRDFPSHSAGVFPRLLRRYRLRRSGPGAVHGFRRFDCQRAHPTHQRESSRPRGREHAHPRQWPPRRPLRQHPW